MREKEGIDSLLEGLKAWALELVKSYGQFGLFVVAFAESSFFPIPPDVLIIALVLPPTDANPFITGLVCTVGSVSGAIAGWLIGRWGGRPILDRLFHPEKVQQVEKLYDRYGVSAVLIAAFTPIPYKVFTIASGVFRLNIISFTVASVIGRGMRFFLVAYLTKWFGGWVIQRLDKAMLAVLVVVGVALGAYWIYRKRQNKLVKDKIAGS
ncbi:MAG: DedA family protein [Armatimonadetes bacterium]|nr:DedA family protein [Armatimonadota bacterium]MCX7968256.1 DedA family protein [Armatimonadota bacterium]MDW8143020.1 YqaA family protein [Armatimonadota bacterium]